MKQPAIEIGLKDLEKMTPMDILDFLREVGIIEVIYILDKVLIEDKQEDYNG